MPITNDDLDNWFTYHAPSTEQQYAYRIIRDSARVFALAVLAYTPSSADQTTAIRKIREAVMTANAAIACRGK